MTRENEKRGERQRKRGPIQRLLNAKTCQRGRFFVRRSIPAALVGRRSIPATLAGPKIDLGSARWTRNRVRRRSRRPTSAAAREPGCRTSSSKARSARSSRMRPRPRPHPHPKQPVYEAGSAFFGASSSSSMLRASLNCFASSSMGFTRSSCARTESSVMAIAQATASVCV